MCGIFGCIVKTDAGYDRSFLKYTMEILGRLSESRGKESAGFAVYDLTHNQINVLKGSLSISRLLKTKDCQEFLRKSFGLLRNINGEPLAVIGHSRLVTNGSQLIEHNNQPVVKDGIIGVHNGIIVNVDKLWEKFTVVRREYEVDTEVILSLIRFYLNKTTDLQQAITRTFAVIKGTASVAIILDNHQQVLLATNNGSLYLAINQKSDIILFASEKYILAQLLNNKSIRNPLGTTEIVHIKPNICYLIDAPTLATTVFSTLDSGAASGTGSDSSAPQAKINITSVSPPKFDPLEIASLGCNVSASREAYLHNLLQYNISDVNNLKRCTRCILPETFPFIHFDQHGVCNICNNYSPKNQPKPLQELIDLITPYKRKNGEPDCIVPYSGGRDSSFCLHFVKRELGLNPIAFTYDWGMVTDLARRNIARVCGKLGVENIIVSADIRLKRENIRENIIAWLKRPELGMIPLFMAGDKYFFYYTQRLKKQTGIKLNIWGGNNLERTDFKVGFCGIGISYKKPRIYSLDLLSKLKLFLYVYRNMVLNPSYINSSLLDSLGSFFVRYLYPEKDYYLFYDHKKWDEHEIETTLFNEYDWEVAPDTKTTWRIGDGTVGFYNYIYYTLAGFSEYDTFRSNQIREGMLSREQALEMVNDENRPRYESIKWYLDILGLDFENIIKKINNIPKLVK